MTNKIYGINGPVVTVAKTDDFAMLEMVHVGNLRLIGEVIGITSDFTTIQVYEDTSGLECGEPVVGSGQPLCALLGPGLLKNIFDGIGRPLLSIAEETGAFIGRGIEISALDTEKVWDNVKICVMVGDKISAGRIYATLPETPMIEHRCLVPAGISGEVIFCAADGSYKVTDTIIKIKDEKDKEISLSLAQLCPIRRPRPVAKRHAISKPLITGQRIIDTLFPIAKGGTAAIPGGFGTGKTLTQHQLAKWCDADVIIYVGCGERGNEMTQVLEEFGSLVDPRSGHLLTDRTVLIANTSNMPVSAREASIYTGITLAEYYRDMGYHVAIMADSTSRWAEALRELSGRLEEMPAEEGFPAYLSSRLSEFYERGGYVSTLSGAEGSITIIGAVSPQGGDFSEPVTQNTKRYIRTFLALDRALAYSRHFPAINWINSYSEYAAELVPWYNENVSEDFYSLREKLIAILAEENKLQEVVKLIGSDVLPDDQKLIIEVSKIIRSAFLQQNAYNEVDTFVPMSKQYLLMKSIITFYEGAKNIVAASVPLARILETNLGEKIIRSKYEIKNDDFAKINEIIDEIKNTCADVLRKNRV